MDTQMDTQVIEVATPQGPVPVPAEISFTEAVKRVAQSRGYSAVRVYLAGALISEDNAPDKIVEGVLITPYDLAG
jgi:hypothetical protein